METAINTQQPSRKPNIVKIVANILIVMIGLCIGAAIVHGMVLQQCGEKKDNFVAGVLPDDVQVQKEQQATGEPADLQQCVSNDENKPFEAGVLPDEEDPGLAGPTVQPSAQGSTAIPQIENTPSTVTRTTAPAPQPAPQPRPADPKPVDLNQTQRIPTPQPAPKPASKPATPTIPTKKNTTSAATKSSKTVSVDLDKLSMAVAMQETHNCQDTKGSALYNNCHGFKKNGQFMHFSTPAQSHEYFKQLWAKSYGGGFPTYRLAQIYSGNDRPTTWLKNVTYYYNSL